MGSYSITTTAQEDAALEQVAQRHGVRVEALVQAHVSGALQSVLAEAQRDQQDDVFARYQALPPEKLKVVDDVLYGVGGSRRPR
jgi:hypothetical protein